MAPASLPSSRRFYDCLKGLQEEFERRSNDTPTKGSSSRRFNIYLGNLKGEFELMSLEIETLQEERNRYKEKVEIQTKELQGVRPNLACERCSMETSGAPQITVPSKPKSMKTTTSLFSNPFFQFKSLDKLGTSSGVDVIQGTTSRRPSQHTTLIQKLHSVITSTRPSRSVSHPESTDSQTVTFPSPLPQASASTANPNVVPEGHGGSIQFNNNVEKELDVEIAHTLSLGDVIGFVKFSRDGKYLAAGCWDGKTYIYNVEAGTLNCVLRNLLAEEDKVISVCFSQDGKYLATGTLDGVLFVWEIKTKYVRNAFKGHTNGIMSLDFSPNGRLLLSASADNTVRLWNMRDGATKLLTEENPTILDGSCYTSAVFSPDGNHVAASRGDGVVRIWNVHTGRLTKRTEADHNWVNSVAFLPDGKGLMSGGGDGKLRYWDVSSLDSTRFRSRPQTTKHSRGRASVEGWMRQEREFVGHEGTVQSIATTPDGRWIASGSSDRSVRIWDSRSAETQCILNHGDVWTVDISPAGGYFASGGMQPILRIWRYSPVAFGDS